MLIFQKVWHIFRQACFVAVFVFLAEMSISDVCKRHLLVRNLKAFAHFRLTSLLFSPRVDRKQIDQADFTCWISLLSSNLIKKISPNPEVLHCVKSIQIRRFFWSVFSCIRTRKNFVFGHFSRSA